MNDSPAVPLVTIVATSLWLAVAITILAAWALLIADHLGASILMGLTSGVLAPAASLASARGYLIRIAGLIRAGSSVACSTDDQQSGPRRV